MPKKPRPGEPLKERCPECGWTSHERPGTREYDHSWVVHRTFLCPGLLQVRPAEWP